MHGIFVSVEGISGVGKTYLCSLFRHTYPDLPLVFLPETPEWCGTHLGSRITDLLKENGDLFFRNDYPLTTTFLLLANTMYKHEATSLQRYSDRPLVFTDRSIDSIAIYQAILLHPHACEQQLQTAHDLYALAVQWCPPPDVTFLIDDDFATAIHRAEQRNDRRYPDDELALLRRAHHLYQAYTPYYPSRIIRISRQQMTAEEVVAYMYDQIQRKLEGGNHDGK